MKGLNINISSCTSQNSTAIISSNMESFPSSSSSSSSSSFTPGTRALDRHNPIITDERRSGFSNNNSCSNTPIRTPCTNHVLQSKPTTPTTKSVSPKPHPISTPTKKGNKLPTLTKKSSKKNNAYTKSPVYSSNNDIIIEGDDLNKSGRRSFSKPSDLIMKASVCTNTRPGVDYISPPESSRYLLDDTSFIEVLSDFDPVLKLVPSNNHNNNDDDVEVVKSEGSKPPKPSFTTGSSDQVVVLRVSLHCRGCEKKMKKHLSRMADNGPLPHYTRYESLILHIEKPMPHNFSKGVTSFNIDFAAKKVTVVGDVTPLGVLASISKVKTAKLWAPAMSSIFPAELKKHAS